MCQILHDTPLTNNPTPFSMDIGMSTETEGALPDYAWREESLMSDIAERCYTRRESTIVTHLARCARTVDVI
ncbi:MAG: hypothetical protein J07HQW1_01755 [Haloquadratum walsbyi J07HQW1]|jgi:hypothetical protein|uniref:Uncharacterized protein n=1 Tax=Haloquadratum walsbyi J07HQW1 TaxID=1238424 RepID=U1PHS7_9EURY|nr:MAG: hypothetical protein J07HQW1_01755 [Haloquadratum walsbyi J07HQW1]